MKAGQKRTHWMWFIFPRHADRDDRHGVAIDEARMLVLLACGSREFAGGDPDEIGAGERRTGGSHWRGCLGRSAG
ncbi:MAG: DUF1810 family protein [Halochromatium sp.]